MPRRRRQPRLLHRPADPLSNKTTFRLTTSFVYDGRDRFISTILPERRANHLEYAARASEMV